MEYQAFRRSGLSVLECRIVKKLYTFTRFGKLDVLKNVEETAGYKIAMGLLENVKNFDDFTVALWFRRIRSISDCMIAKQPQNQIHFRFHLDIGSLIRKSRAVADPASFVT